jgi:hypothetical protein
MAVAGGDRIGEEFVIQMRKGDGIEDDGTPGQWISAAKAVEILKSHLGSYTAQQTICTRAHSGLVRARAERLTMDNKPLKFATVPAAFWWARGHQALEQNWAAGDFSTWLDHEVQIHAFGVKFLRADIEKLLPEATAVPPVKAAPGGRPKADWWDDLWIEICRQLYVGELIPKRQADLENAMLEWLAKRGETPSTSTIRERAKKLWAAIGDEN